jgi:catalase
VSLNGSHRDPNEQSVPNTTTDAGIPAASDDHSLTVGPDGPILLQDHYVIQKMQAFNRERVPERVVHAKGGGAFGYFEVTVDVRQWTKAAFLNTVGKRTPVAIRFSTVAGEQGSADTVRDPRGWAMKFYTEEGNYDLVGNNTPVFFIRDPSKFSDFIHSQKRMGADGLRSNNAQWDFWSLQPAAYHQVAILMTDRGTPRTWRNMNGYSSHTYVWVNADGKRVWVKYHFKTEQGIQNFTAAEAQATAGADPDFHRRDLFDSIKRGDYPAWKLEMQIMPFEDAATYRFNPFDLTKIWPHSDYSADHHRPAGAESESRKLLCRDRAGRIRAVEHGARHRSQPRQDAVGPSVQLPRHAPVSDRHQLPAAACQSAAVRGPQLQPGWPHALRAPGQPAGVRTQQLRWA